MRLKVTPPILVLIFLSVTFNAAGTAHAVIPQLLGPLSALLSIVPQILAVVGIAFLTVFVFARDWLKGLFYRIRESALLTTITLILLLVYRWCRGLGSLWNSSIRSTVRHNEGRCFA